MRTSPLNLLSHNLSRLPLLAIAAAAASLPVLSASSCSPNLPQITVTIEAPDELKDQAAFTQIAVFDGSCPDKEKLKTGNLEGARLVRTAPKNGAFTEIGQLSKSTYGFAAIMRKADCSVFAEMCVDVDFNIHGAVKFTFDTNDVIPAPQGACNSAAGEQCIDGRCKSSSDGGLPDSPNYQGCPLKIVQAGNFQGPSNDSAHFDGPAAIVTPDGFVIATRQGAVDELSATMKLVPLDLDGTPGTPQATAIQSCPGLESERGGVSGTWGSPEGGTVGIVVSSAKGCDKPDAGTFYKNVFNVVTFEKHGTSPKVTVYADPQISFELSPRHAATPAPGGRNTFKVAMTRKNEGTQADREAFVFTLEVNENHEIPQPTAPPVFNNGDGPAERAFAISSGGRLVVVADNVANSDAPFLNVAVEGAEKSLRLDGNSQPLGLASALGYVAVSYRPTDGSAPIKWAQISLEHGTLITEGTSTTSGVATDIAAAGNHLVLATGTNGDIVLERLDRTSQDQPFQPSSVSVHLSEDERAPTSINQFTGAGRNLAMAWNKGRLLVTWINTTADISSSQFAGGYAVLACDGN